MAAWRHPTLLLLALHTDLAIEIACHLAMTSERHMDGLRSLWTTYLSMHHIYGDPAVDRRMALDRWMQVEVERS